MRFIAVDDEPFALKNIVKAIKAAEPRAAVQEFKSSAHALAFAEENPVDVAFLDIEMRGLNGLELAKRIKDIREKINIVFVTGFSEYALDAFSLYASGYILKPASPKAIADTLRHLRNPIPKPTDKGLRVQTFGNFEVFMDGKALHFPRSKSKELFAYLISKRGTGCSSKEIAAVLFEDQPYGIALRNQVQTAISVMQSTLTKAGADDVIIRTYNNTAVDVSKINCDYYRFMNWELDAINEYMGEYMSNYSWAEFYTGYLDSKVMGSKYGG